MDCTGASAGRTFLGDRMIGTSWTGGSLNSMDDRTRSVAADRNSFRSLEAKSSSKPTNSPLMMRNSMIRPDVSSLSPWNSSSRSLFEGDDKGVPDDERELMCSFWEVMEAMIRRQLGEENSHFGSEGGLADFVGVAAANVCRRRGPSEDDTESLRRCRDDTDRGRSCIDNTFLVHRTWIIPFPS